MNNHFEILRRTLREEIQENYSLPSFLDETVDFFRKAHIYYRTYKYTKIHENASQDSSRGHPAIYGAALQLIGDYTSIGAYAINVALVTKCAQDLLEQYRLLGKDYQKLCQAVNWQYPLYYPIEWQKEKKTSSEVLSPSLYLNWQVHIMGWIRQIQKITRCTLDVFWQMFKLSMCLCDAYLLFNDDPQTRYIACTELVAEWDQYQDQLKENQKRLAKEIEKSRPFIDHLLEQLGIEKKSSFIIDQLKETFETISEATEDVLEDIYDVAVETVDTVYAKGKITPLHIDLAEGNAIAPALPPGRFPPWAGQTVTLAPPAQPAISLPKDPLKSVKNLLADNVPLIGKASKGLQNLATRVQQLYKKHAAASAPFSPFA